MVKNQKYNPELIAQGHRIRFIRKYFNLTQADFAKNMNVSVAAVSNWEKGYARIGLTQVHHLLIDAHVSADFVIAGHTYSLTVQIRDAWRQYEKDNDIKS